MYIAECEHVPFFIMTCKNLMTTLLLGRIKTCLFPRFSALYMDLRASPSTLMRTILAYLRAERSRYLTKSKEALLNSRRLLGIVWVT
jgi:hypothetical protein